MIMKNTFIIAVVAMILAGCFGGKSTEPGPGEVVQEYYKAICSGDFGKAASLCDTICITGHIEEVRNVWEQQDSTITAIIADILSETEVEITDIQKDGDNRNVFYKLANPSYEGKEEIAVVGNEEGEWKIKSIITDRQ